MMKQPVLSAGNLEKSFTLHMLGGKILHGCQGINFDLHQGQFLGVSGPSGTGKSTVLKCIYRTYLPTGGRLIYHSERFGPIDLVTATEQQILVLRQSEIGYISQFLQVIPRVSALEIVADGLIQRGTERQQGLKSAKEMLKYLEIPEELWDACPSTFSGGEKQRVNIARAVVCRPKLLLLDEPTASLDGMIQQKVLEILRGMKREGTTMIGIFHDLELMNRVADLKLSMIDGALTAVA